MRYQLMSAVDRRDGVTALWLLRCPAGAQEFRECAYLGAKPKVKDVWLHASRIKRTTFANSEFYVFENMLAWVVHADHITSYMVDSLEVKA